MKSNWREAAVLLSAVAITRAESHFDGYIEYHGFSNLFDEIEDGVEAPEYTAELFKRADGVVLLHRFTRS